MKTSPNKLSSTLKQGQKQSQDQTVSNLNSLQNNKSNLLTQTVVPKKGHQTDNYEGPVDPVTRMRHGIGVYRYSNKFFTYQGNFEQGVKQGKGVLKLADGTIINGAFQGGELVGQSQIFYADGSTYKGQLKYGQKNGYGVFKSRMESYEGQYRDNKRHGQGTLITPTIKIVGTFEDNKPHGSQITITKYNYEFKGSCSNGKKSGTGTETSSYADDCYKYSGQYKNDKFEGKGVYTKSGNLDSYCYDGNFIDGKPSIYPNQFRVFLGSSVGVQSQKPNQEAFNCITTDQLMSSPVEYQLEGQNQLYFIIETCYQAPQQLDPNQPTQQQIQKMIKDWQNQNKKNKNPPPMPDFRQPRKIKPALVLVDQESQRIIQIKLAKIEGTQSGPLMKVDYRQSMKKKRAQNQITKAQAAKKAEEQGNKKGGKAPAKGQLQLKVNAYSDNPKQQEKLLRVRNKAGKAEIQKLQFPDDFPVGSYHLIISSPFTLFGQIKEIKKTINIKQKNAGGKKK